MKESEVPKGSVCAVILLVYSGETKEVFNQKDGIGSVLEKIILVAEGG